MAYVLTINITFGWWVPVETASKETELKTLILHNSNLRPHCDLTAPLPLEPAVDTATVNIFTYKSLTLN